MQENACRGGLLKQKRAAHTATDRSRVVQGDSSASWGAVGASKQGTSPAITSARVARAHSAQTTRASPRRPPPSCSALARSLRARRRDDGARSLRAPRRPLVAGPKSGVAVIVARLRLLLQQQQQQQSQPLVRLRFFPQFRAPMPLILPLPTSRLHAHGRRRLAPPALRNEQPCEIARRPDPLRERLTLVAARAC